MVREGENDAKGKQVEIDDISNHSFKVLCGWMICIYYPKACLTDRTTTGWAARSVLLSRRAMNLRTHRLYRASRSPLQNSTPYLALSQGRSSRKSKKQADTGTYAEKEYFSQRHKQWSRYFVKLPRLPKDGEGKEKWLETKFQPRTLGTFLGKHNAEIIDTLTHIRDNFEISMQFPSLFVVYGPGGSGKTALVKVLLRELYDGAGMQLSNVPKWIMQIDCEKQDVTKMWNKIISFGNAKPDQSIPAAFKILVLDGADHIPPSAQQILKKVIYDQEGKVKYILVCRNQNKLIGHILSRGMAYRTRPMLERDAVSMVLTTLSRESIGYNREGIRELFAQAKTVQLREIVETVQEIFVRYHYLSRESVLRIYAERDKREVAVDVSPQAAIEPLQRCSICTLFPPCRHITQEELDRAGLARRSELPRRKKGLACQEFASTGHCSLFNKHHHCSLDHPMTLHNVVPAPRRCPQCTLVWPCNHCAFSDSRLELEDVISVLKTRLGVLNQIAVDAPPLALTSHLIEPYPDFKTTLLKMKRDVTVERLKVLSGNEAWLNSTLSTSAEEYRVKTRMLQITFHAVFGSPLLDPPPKETSGNKPLLQQPPPERSSQPGSPNRL